MKKLTNLFIVFILLFTTTTSAFGIAVKSKNTKDKKKKNAKPKTLDRVYGNKGIMNESKSALISVDPLKLQNYANSTQNFNFEDYKKVTLKSVILETLSQSNIIKSANEKVVQLQLGLKDAYAAYLPLLDFQYSNKYTTNLKTGDEKTDTPAHANIGDENYGFRVRQSLYSGGATSLKIKSLKAKYEEGKRKYLIVVEQEMQKAIKAYFDVLFSYKNVKINERNMDKLNKILEITQVKYDSGALSIGDLSSVKANIANASSKLIKIKSSLADALDYYNYLLNDKFKETNPYQEDFKLDIKDEKTLLQDIIQNNLSLVNYRLNIESTKYKLLNIKATFKPKVDLELSYKNVLNKEDFKANEESYYAKVTLSYPIYNAGKDTRKVLTSYSSLRELKFRYQEEIKKIKWSTKKLFKSVDSLDKTIASTQEEVSASKEMIDSYWEGFQLGEQDLSVLLQGQRQLNSAQLDLIKYKKDYLTNLFKILQDTGHLSSFFHINSNDPKFIDFAQTDMVTPQNNINLSPASHIVKTKKPKDLNTTIDEYLEIVKNSTFDDTINFKDKFLVSNDNNYTLIISKFTNNYDAYSFMKTNRLLNNSFSYEYFDKNGEIVSQKTKEKVVNVRTNIAYGIYSSKDTAIKSQNNLIDKANKEFKVVKISKIKQQYNKYVEGLETTIKPFIIKPKIIKTFITNQKFKNKFLKAPKHFYTINIVSFSKLKYAASLVYKKKIYKDSFVFKYGRNGEWVKVVYGVFPTYYLAVEALNKYPDMINKYHPIVEKIINKQNLYKKYKRFNYLPKWYLDEQKAKKLKKEQKVTAKKSKNNSNSQAIAEQKKKAQKEQLAKEKKLKSKAIKDAKIKAQKEKDAKAKALQIEEERIAKEKEKQRLADEKALELKLAKENELKLQAQKLKAEKLKKEQLAKKKAEALEKAKLKAKNEQLAKEKAKKLEEKRLADEKEERRLEKIKKEKLAEEKIISHKRVLIDTPIPKEINLELVEIDSIDEENNKTENEKKLAKEKELKQLAKKKAEALKKEKAKQLEDEKLAKEKKLKAKAIKEAKIKAQKEKEAKAKALQIEKEKIAKEKEKQRLADEKALELKLKKEKELKLQAQKLKAEKLKKEQLAKKKAEALEKAKLKAKNEQLAKEKAKKLEEKRLADEKEKRKIEKEQIKDVVTTSIKKVFKISNFKIFDSAFNNAPKDYYTIELSEVAKKDKANFISRFILGDTYTSIDKNNRSKIVFGIYKDKKSAIDEIENLHPRIINKAKVVQIGKIRKVELKKQKEEEKISKTKANKKQLSIEKVKKEKKKIVKIKKAKSKNKTVKKVFTIKDYKSFTNAFNNAPKSYYTIKLGEVAQNKKKYFIKRFVLGDNYTTITKNQKSKIFFGIYKDKKSAINEIENLHPRIQNKVKILTIKRAEK